MQRAPVSRRSFGARNHAHIVQTTMTSTHNRTHSSSKRHRRTHSSSSKKRRNHSFDKSYNPRANLTIEQNETLNSFITRMADIQSRKERKFCTEACLIRYLKARDWDLEKAEKMLRATLEWRREFQPDKIDPRDLKEEASTGKLYVRGKDKMGRPLLYMIPRNENSKDYQKNIKLLVYTLERAIQQMDDGVEQLVLMMDFKGWSRHNSVPLSVSRQVLGILSNHYPERLGCAFMIDTPWLFSLFWKAISPFIHPNTASKVKFVSNKGKHFAEHMDVDELEERFSGKSTNLVMEEHWVEEVQVYERILSRKSKHSRTISQSSIGSSEDMD